VTVPTAVTIRDNTVEPPKAVSLSARTSLLPSASEYETYIKLAEQFMESGFLPSAIKKPAQALAIMLMGRELGLQPMQSLRMLHVIEGKPGMSAELILARFRQAGGRYRWLEKTDKCARIQLVAPGNPDDWAEEFEFTIEEARRAEVTGKQNWKKYPAAMLRARVASLAVRAVAPEVSAGLHDPDELGADVNDRGEVEAWPEPEKREERERKTPSGHVITAVYTGTDDDPILPVGTNKLPLSDPNVHIGLVLGFIYKCVKANTIKDNAGLIQKAMASFPVKLASATLDQLSATAKWITDDENKRRTFRDELPMIEARLEELTTDSEQEPDHEARGTGDLENAEDVEVEPMTPIADVVGAVERKLAAAGSPIPVVHDDDLAALTDPNADLPFG
jgi:hypothetical protein